MPKDELSQSDITPDPSFRDLEIVIYMGDFKVVGVAHFGLTTRAGSHRASDYIRAFPDTRLTLSNVRIYDKTSRELFEEVPFVIVNLDKIDFLYARDEFMLGDGAEQA